MSSIRCACLLGNLTTAFDELGAHSYNSSVGSVFLDVVVRCCASSSIRTEVILNMRIGVISDTHTPGAAKEPPQEVARAFEGVEHIFHAGDIYISSCLDWLERIAPVTAVELGSQAHFNGDPRVAEKRVFELEGYTIAMVHDLIIPGMGGEVMPGSIPREFPPTKSLPAAVEGVFGASIDIIVFGHTHHAVVEEHQGILLVNPGSPSLPKQVRRLGQVAILELLPGKPQAKIVDLSDFS